MKNKWIYYLVAAVVVIALIIGAPVYYVYYVNSKNYVATVAGQKIKTDEYKFFIGLVKQEMERAANLADENAKKTFWDSQEFDGKNVKEVAKNKALENAQEVKILLMKAKENKLKLDKNDLDIINRTVDGRINEAGGRIAADNKLKQEYGVDVPRYREIMQEVFLASKFMQQEQKNENVSDDEIKKYYESKKDELDTATIRHILISTKDKDNKDLPEDKKQEQKKKAEEIMAMIKSGKDMIELAKQYSQDPGVKENNGEYAVSKNGQYVKEFEDWALKAKVGDIGIVTTTFGYHVMKLEKRTSLNDIKDTIKENLLKDKYTKKLEDWKKNQQFNIVKNTSVIDTIKVTF